MALPELSEGAEGGRRGCRMVGKEVAGTKRIARLILGALHLIAGRGPARYVPPKSAAPSSDGGLGRSWLPG
jgi:hypothetical protein